MTVWRENLGSCSRLVSGFIDLAAIGFTTFEMTQLLGPSAQRRALESCKWSHSGRSSTCWVNYLKA